MEGELNISPLVVWVVALTQLLTFGMTLWNMMSSGSRKNAATLETHGRTLHSLEERVNAVEHRLGEMPRRDDFHALDKEMTELRGAMGVLGERLKPVEATLERLHDVLLAGGRA